MNKSRTTLSSVLVRCERHKVVIHITRRYRAIYLVMRAGARTGRPHQYAALANTSVQIQLMHTRPSQLLQHKICQSHGAIGTNQCAPVTSSPLPNNTSVSKCSRRRQHVSSIAAFELSWSNHTDLVPTAILHDGTQRSCDQPVAIPSALQPETRRMRTPHLRTKATPSRQSRVSSFANL